MGIHYKKVQYVPELAVPNPFNARDKAWGSIVNNERKEKIAWRLVAVSSIAFFALSLYFLNRAMNLPRTVPLVITVAPWGEATYVGDVSSNAYETLGIPDVAFEFHLREFISMLRRIPRDPEIMSQDIARCYSMVTPPCGDRMSAALRKEDRFSQFGSLRRTVSIESILRLSKDSWQVDWIETSTGSTTATDHVRGVFTLTRRKPTEKQKKVNPLGIFIDDYDTTIIPH